MKKITFYCVLIISNIIYSQEVIDFNVLNKTFSYSYNEGHNVFKICEIMDMENDCKEYPVKEDLLYLSLDDFDEKASQYFKNIPFELYGEKITKKDLDNISFNNLSYTPTAEELLNLEINSSKDLTILDNFLSLSIRVRKDEDSIYHVESSSDILIMNDIEPIVKPIDKDELKTKLNTALKKIFIQSKDNIVESLTDGYSEYKKYLQDYFDKSISKKEKYTYLTTQSFQTNNNPAKTVNYIFKLLVDKNLFYLKACIANENSCSNFGPYLKSITQTEYEVSFFRKISNLQYPHDNNVETIKSVYQLINNVIEKKALKEKNEKLLKEILSLSDSLDNEKNSYSGTIKLNKKVPFYIKNENKEWDSKSKQTIIFYPKSAVVKFFNNRIDELSVVGYFEDDKETEITLSNSSWSIPVKGLDKGSQVSSYGDNYRRPNDKLKYLFRDIVSFTKENSYAIKNSTINLKPGEIKKITERKFLDYFTGIIFTDLFGLNSNNGNSLILAEGRARIPLNNKNKKYCTWFDHLNLYGSANLVNNVDNISKTVQLDTIVRNNPEEFSAEEFNGFKTNNFNLLSNQNFEFGTDLGFFTYEAKRYNSFIHFQYGLRFLRTRLEYSLFDRDVVTEEGDQVEKLSLFATNSFQVYSLGQEIEVNFEIRPQDRIGADVSIGLSQYRATGTNKNDIDITTLENSSNLKVMANVYTFLNKDKGKSGLFFRLGGHYNLETYQLFPRIMFGYATNLTSFINMARNKK